MSVRSVLIGAALGAAVALGGVGFVSDEPFAWLFAGGFIAAALGWLLVERGGLWRLVGLLLWLPLLFAISALVTFEPR